MKLIILTMTLVFSLSSFGEETCGYVKKMKVDQRDFLNGGGVTLLLENSKTGILSETRLNHPGRDFYSTAQSALRDKLLFCFEILNPGRESSYYSYSVSRDARSIFSAD